jgi:1-hydroxycarotenoid 3,4-desaturase
MTTVIIGAGVGGLSAAITLAAKGEKVVVLEAQTGAGGKLLPVNIGNAQFDSGPTVLTMAWVFDELFGLAGQSLLDHLKLLPLPTLARHYWSGGATIDLFADQNETIDAIGTFAGSCEAEGYRAFAAASKRIHHSLMKPFLKSQRPTPWSLAASMPLSEMLGINPFETYWHALSRYFKDPRLQQLFGRYATYCGSSPFHAPATLMLVADVEASGVWRVEGGMAEIAKALENCARKLGVEFHFNCKAQIVEKNGACVSAVIDQNGTRHACSVVIVNADSAALPAGFFGEDVKHAAPTRAQKDQSLSAITWCAETKEQGVALEHHTVFFSDNYKKEFAELAHGLAQDPTVYLCDQGQGRKLMLINAPADAKDAPQNIDDILLSRLRKSGLNLTMQSVFRRSPKDFTALYPASSGAIYGRAAHGWLSTFQRPQARTKIHGLYLAGGTVHPGPGVPMAALSGMRAAEVIWQDRAMM